MTYKLDMFKDVLPSLDKCDLDRFSKMSEEEQKSFQPVVALQFMSAIKGNAEGDYIDFVNSVANYGFHDLYKHKNLQWKLLATAGLGKPQRHYWVPMTKQSNNKLYMELLKLNPDLKEDEVLTVVKIYGKSGIKQLAMDAGWQDKEIKELLKLI